MQTMTLDRDQDEDDFRTFLERVEKVITRASGVGLGREDFADAGWRDLWGDLGEDASDQDIMSTLAEADPLFCDLAKLTGALPVDHQPGDF